MKIMGSTSGKHGVRDVIISRFVDRLGGKIVQEQRAPVPDNTDIYFSWRFNLCPSFPEIIESGTMMVCIDLGYFDKTKYERFSISINGVHGNSVPVLGNARLPERPHPELQPWRPEGSGHVIQLATGGALPDPTAVRAAASNLPEDWDRFAVDKARKIWPDKEIVLRYHPRGLPKGAPKPPPLRDTFDETYCSVTYGSNTAVQTIIAGVPTVVEATRCVAYSVATPEYKIFRSSDREAWIHDLSYREYDMMDDKELDCAIEYIMRGYEQLRGAI